MAYNYAESPSGPFDFFGDLFGGLLRTLDFTPQYNLEQAQGPIRGLAPSYGEAIEAFRRAQELGIDLSEGQRAAILGIDPSRLSEAEDAYRRTAGEGGFSWENYGGRPEDMVVNQQDFISRFGTTEQDSVEAAAAWAALQEQLRGQEFRDRLDTGIGDLQGRAQKLIDTPVYSEGEINRLLQQNQEFFGQSYDNTLQALEQGLGERGVAGSGIQTDLQARLGTEALRSTGLGANQIQSTAERENREAQERGIDILGQLENIRLLGDQFATGLEDPSAIFNALSGVGQQLSGTEFLNASLTQGALRSLQQQQQQQFENIMSLGGLFGSFLPSGGGGGGGGSSWDNFTTGLTVGL